MRRAAPVVGEMGVGGHRRRDRDRDRRRRRGAVRRGRVGDGTDVDGHAVIEALVARDQDVAVLLLEGEAQALVGDENGLDGFEDVLGGIMTVDEDSHRLARKSLGAGVAPHQVDRLPLVGVLGRPDRGRGDGGRRICLGREWRGGRTIGEELLALRRDRMAGRVLVDVRVRRRRARGGAVQARRRFAREQIRYVHGDSGAINGRGCRRRSSSEQGSQRDPGGSLLGGYESHTAMSVHTAADARVGKRPVVAVATVKGSLNYETEAASVRWIDWAIMSVCDRRRSGGGGGGGGGGKWADTMITPGDPRRINDGQRDHSGVQASSRLSEVERDGERQRQRQRVRERERGRERERKKERGREKERAPGRKEVQRRLHRSGHTSTTKKKPMTDGPSEGRR